MTDFEIKLIQHALQEDGYQNDITGNILVEKNKIATGNFVARRAGIVSGVDIVQQIYKLINPKVQVTVQKPNGSFVQRGSVIITLHGPLRDILKGKNVAINFLDRLCGVATLTNQYVMELKTTNCQILDTRNNTPNNRPFEKRAVLHGGGTNHNFSLNDCISISKPHLLAFGSVTEALQMVKSKNKNNLVVEIEVENKEDFLEAVDGPCDLIIFKRMDKELIKELIGVNHGRKSIALWDDYTIKEVYSLAKLGVDYIIIDELTYGYKVMNIELKFYKGI